MRCGSVVAARCEWKFQKDLLPDCWPRLTLTVDPDRPTERTNDHIICWRVYAIPAVIWLKLHSAGLLWWRSWGGGSQRWNEMKQKPSENQQMFLSHQKIKLKNPVAKYLKNFKNFDRLFDKDIIIFFVILLLLICIKCDVVDISMKVSMNESFSNATPHDYLWLEMWRNDSRRAE